MKTVIKSIYLVTALSLPTLTTYADSTNTIDTGTPTNDTGTPASNTGTPTKDTGTPTKDTGTPASNTGTPTKDTGTPASNTGTPTNNTGTPTSNTDTPTSNTDTPTSNTSAPPSNTGASTSTSNSNASSFIGEYQCQRVDSANNTASFPLTVSKTGDTYTLQWENSNGDPVLYGTGVMHPHLSNVVASSFWDPAKPDTIGIQMIEIKPDGSLQSNWVLQSDNQIGTETCTKK